MYYKERPSRETPQGGRRCDGWGSEVAGCEYNNPGLRFQAGRKRAVEFVQVVLFVEGVVVDILFHIML